MPSDNTLIILGRLLKQARKSKNLSLRSLSDACGVPKSTIARYEAGRDGSIKNIDAVCRALGLDYSELVDTATLMGDAEPFAMARAGYPTPKSPNYAKYRVLIDLYDALSPEEQEQIINLMRMLGAK